MRLHDTPSHASLASLTGLTFVAFLSMNACDHATPPPAHAHAANATTAASDHDDALHDTAATNDAGDGTRVASNDTSVPDAGAESADASTSTSIEPAWAHGSVSERLYALHVGDDAWARRDLFTWTTHAQVAAMRGTRTLLVATADTRGPPSPFVWLVDARSRAHKDDDASAVAALLAKSARFTRRRYAWSVGYATVLGLSSKRYGDELVAVHLKSSSWIVELAPERDPQILVRDLDQHEIPLDRARAEPERIAAVYHVRLGSDVPARYREYVLVNEDAIEQWEVGTPRVHAEVDAEATLLRDLRVELRANPQRLSNGPFAAWTHIAEDATLRSLWQATLAFENDRYQLEDVRLGKAIDALGAYARETPELVITR